MFNKYALLIHGPFETQWMSQIKSSIQKFEKRFDQIIIVSYINDYQNYSQLLDNLNLGYKVDFVTVKDTVNPGFFNINRQLICVKAGLEKIESGSYVFKLRNDQSVDFNKILPHISNKIITTNCFTRSDRLYHPSDMFLAGPLEEMKDLYSMSLVEETHLMTQMRNQILYQKDPTLKALPICPETLLCRNYLQIKNWKFLETKEDSYNAVKTYYTVLNSWNIDYRWHKKRTHLCPKDFFVMPHYFTIAPFEGFPEENAKCYLASDFTNKNPSFKDLFYFVLAKCVWFFWEPQIKGYRYYRDKYKRIQRKCRYMILGLFPYFMVANKMRRLKEKIR